MRRKGNCLRVVQWKRVAMLHTGRVKIQAKRTATMTTMR